MSNKKNDYIFLTADEVQRAIDTGSCQIRRVIKPQPPYGSLYCINGNKTHALCFAKTKEIDLSKVIVSLGDVRCICVPPTASSTDHRLPCPYGAPGDTLWVKETWCPLDYPHHALDPTLPRDAILYGGRKNGVAYRASCFSVDSERCRKELGYKWRPPVTMPRWASRLTLQIVNIEIEYLSEFLWLVSFKVIEP